MKSNKMKLIAADFEFLKFELHLEKKKLKIAKKALNDILKWQETTDDDWDYPETIASNALKKLAKLDDFQHRAKSNI